MPAPRKFTRGQLRATALQMVDEHGLAALTMRSLAAALGTGAMTIYNYVDGRDGLEQLVTEAVMAEATWEAGVSEDWADEAAAIATGIWRAVRSHPNAIPLILTRRSLDTATLDAAEALLGALIRSGRTGTDLLVAFRLTTSFITGYAQSELAGPLATDRGEDPTAAIDRVQNLPFDRYPNLIVIAGAAAASDPEAEFRAGLRILLAGLAMADDG
jgi:AcrR family transcriptional regulator